MTHQPSPEELGAKIADLLLLHAYDHDDAPSTFAAVTLVYEALQAATALVKERRATLVRRALDHVKRSEIARYFGTTMGTINFILRSLPKAKSGD